MLVKPTEMTKSKLTACTRSLSLNYTTNNKAKLLFKIYHFQDLFLYLTFCTRGHENLF